MPRDSDALLDGISPEYVSEATKKGLVLSPNLNLEAWSRVVARLALNARKVTGSADTLCAWLGDVLAYREGRYRGQIAEYARAAGLHPTTLRNAKLVCSRIPMSCRRDDLSWSHHVEIGKAFASAPDIAQWLKAAAKEGLTRAELRQRIRDSRKKPEFASTAAHPAEIAQFQLLRELRGIDRLLQKSRPIWAPWPANNCKRAQMELGSLVEFIRMIGDKAGSGERVVA
jgi:hypothetical protein